MSGAVLFSILANAFAAGILFGLVVSRWAGYIGRKNVPKNFGGRP